MRTLGHWRQLVADRAQEPSRPIPADVLRHAHAVLADDLGIPAVLDKLVTVAPRADVPACVKFETFALFGRVLRMNLAREVGHQHRAATWRRARGPDDGGRCNGQRPQRIHSARAALPDRHT